MGLGRVGLGPPDLVDTFTRPRGQVFPALFLFHRQPGAAILHAYGLRRIELAAAAQVDLKVIHRIARGDFAGLKLGTLSRVAVALGVSPTDLVPALAAKPRSGLIHARSR